MHSNWVRTFAILSLAVTLTCSEATGPGGLVDFLLDFCSTDAILLFAYQNGGGAWTPVAPGVNNAVSFKAAQKLGIAIVRQSGNSFSTEIFYVTRDEIQVLNNRNCAENTGAKILNGSIASVPSGNYMRASMGNSSAYIASTLSTFSLGNLGAGALDLVAKRESYVGNTLTPNKIIVRRALNLPSGAAMPVLDFTATEAVSPATNSVTVTGLTAGESNTLYVDFMTPTVGLFSAYFGLSFATSPQAIYGIPAASTAAGDFHSLEVIAVPSGAVSFRGARQVYRNPGDKTIALGAPLNTPTITAINTSGATRLLRVSLAAQTDYNSFVAVYHSQNVGQRTVAITGTAAYFDNPATWTIDMPDLSAVAGFPAGASLLAGTSTQSTVEAYGGAASLTFDVPTEGAALKFAGGLSPPGSYLMAESSASAGRLQTPLLGLRRFARARGTPSP